MQRATIPASYEGVRLPLQQNDIKEELSYAYVHAVAARAGFSCDRPKRDRQSLDVIVSSEGAACHDCITNETQLGLQLKATARDELTAPTFSFPLPIKNYNDLRAFNMIPRLLVIFIMPTNADEWIEHQMEEHLLSRRCAYWMNLAGFPEVENETNCTVQVPRENILNVASLTELMAQASRLELQYVG